jgi:pilus assembly protein Flp/PilA
MNMIFAKLMTAVDYLKNEEGQDLVEYALLISLIAFACIVGMKGLATDINAVFVALGTQLTSATA